MMISKVCLAVISLAAAAAVSASTLEISGNQTIADADFDSTLDGVTEITFANASSTLTFDLADDHEYSGKVSGAGSVVKIGGGTLSLRPKSVAVAGAYKLTKGWTVTEGCVSFPTNFTSAQTFCHVGPLTVNTPGVVILSNRNFVPSVLSGDGTLTNIANSVLSAQSGTFAGRIVGSISIGSAGNLNLIGTSSTFTGDVTLQDGDHVYGVMSLGFNASASSVGRNNTIRFRSKEVGVTYLGKGEKTDRKLLFLNNSGHATLNGGESGGLDFAGSMGYYKEGSSAFHNMQSLILTGAAGTTNVFSGAFSESPRTTESATYLTKRGAGTWRLEDNASRLNRGTIAVEEGTLEFTSVAETNVVCSLGLATHCATDYAAASWDESKRVDYAYLLGTSNTVGTMEYIGDADGCVTTRTIALKGDGGLSNSGAGTLRWSGVKSVGDEAVSLVLGGDNAGANEVSSVRQGGGAISIVKEGSGTWNAAGLHVTGGLAVRGGTFRLPSNRYRYFRWTIRESGNSCIYLSQFALYDAGGNQVNLGLQPVDAATPPVQMPAGSTCFGITGVKNSSEQVTTPKNLFDGGNSYCTFQREWKKPVEGNPSTHLPIVMHLAEGCPPIVSYDIRGGEKGDVAANRGANSWSLEGSADGLTWDPLDEISGFTPPSTGSNYQWYRVNHENKSFETASTEDAKRANDWSVADLAVAVGARFESDKTIAVNGLTIDAATGGGVVSNIAFGATGTLRVKNSRPGQENLTMTYLDVSGLAENVTGWSVEVNGIPKPNYAIRCRNGQLYLDRPGMVILFR